MARHEYHVVLFLNVFVDCCFSFIPISLTVLLYFISNILAVHPNKHSATSAESKKPKTSKSKSPSKKGNQKAATTTGNQASRKGQVVSKQVPAATTTGNKASTKGEVASKLIAAATTTATSMKRKPTEKKRKEPSLSKLCLTVLFLNC